MLRKSYGSIERRRQIFHTATSSVLLVTPPLTGGSVGFEPPPPSLDGAPIEFDEAPIEGPTRAPKQTTEDQLEGIEFPTPWPDAETEVEVGDPSPDMPTVHFPDPGEAPGDGKGLIVLGGATVALAFAGFGVSLGIGLQRRVPLGWLLPATIFPTTGALVFGGRWLYLGIDGAVHYRRWEIGYRVTGMPQGNGLKSGSLVCLLGAAGFGAYGGVTLHNEGDTELAASLLAASVTLGVAAPIMFGLGMHRARVHRTTGGWRRWTVPPIPTTWAPTFSPYVSGPGVGFTIGALGRF